MRQQLFLERLFLRFVKSESFSGICLFISMLLAFIAANSGFSDWYFKLWHTEFGFSFGGHFLGFELYHWINDVLMSFFFLMVGLEIKREFLIGELSGLQKAIFPVVAALGGMVIPGMIYYGLNLGTESSRGFGIPMATDIAFALGVILLLGKRVPFSLKVFLVTLAVVDDLGAIIVIALFYTTQIYWNYLFFAALVIVVLIFFNKIGIKNLIPYLLLGVLLWYLVHHSGIHATISAVVLAFCIPLQPRLKQAAVLKSFKESISKLNQAVQEKIDGLEHKEIQSLYKKSSHFQSPLERLEHMLHPLSAYFIMPLFAFANAGVRVTSEINLQIDHIFLGILLGLFIGKPLGIFLITFLCDKIGIAKKPEAVGWMHIFGAGTLAGIGFTMSIFVSNLAFSHPASAEVAKVAILSSSFLSAVAGSLLLLLFDRFANKAK
ncbi:sodium/proton antiporter NhaA [Helicobacter mustelae]|uniref:Na(+)/H(+) antiporter NhaA n=1 Tax=Helicobacter mustelae (strain ATCC 43772 / CCUG 25715 / CIP 103759 / LMG 18044 / NCTC 12198 / R85-136P) TaxID=679897 RepID=D3UIE3_HELM1|nr:sodium/proton antiporter NhaA [Helicobacter mustelae]CBG40266.1 putative Na+/H+ antiporter [Helicobacter mustelae 12198]SQH71765.1 Na+/H+ antiporter [Helicobacter mustelae]STP12894.1 Na+/H+ antiporter [Helicobacter mustelae]